MPIVKGRALGRSGLVQGSARTFKMRMRVTVNGEVQEVAEGLTVSGLLAQLSLEGPVAVERNAKVVPRQAHESEILTADDVIEIVHFVGGG